MKRFVFAFLVLALAVASAKSYNVTLFQASALAGTVLKPGDYKLDVKDTKVVISNGKQSVESNVKVEDNGSKFGSTSVRYAAGDNGAQRVQEIRLGGTNMKLVFD